LITKLPWQYYGWQNPRRISAKGPVRPSRITSCVVFF
jgi:hypothetical protein